MHKLKTKHNIKSRDILWLNKSFGEWDKKVEEVNNIFDDQDEDEGIQEKTTGMIQFGGVENC
jgi:hypothetical protein